MAKEIEAAGGRASAFPADVSDPRQVEALVREATSRFGRLDVLVNNAAAVVPGRARVDHATRTGAASRR